MEKEAVEQVLEQLKEENTRLETEYKQLVQVEQMNAHNHFNPIQPKGQNGESENMERNTLKQQKTRLEARMTILEDHNRQLEAQLVRLRPLVNSDQTASEDAPIREIVAANLYNDHGPTHHTPDKRPVPPQFLTGDLTFLTNQNSQYLTSQCQVTRAATAIIE